MLSSTHNKPHYVFATVFKNRSVSSSTSALAMPVVNLFGQCHSDSRCSKRIVIINQSRRICHFLTLWPQLLSRFGNRWRFASTVT